MLILIPPYASFRGVRVTGQESLTYDSWFDHFWLTCPSRPDSGTFHVNQIYSCEEEKIVLAHDYACELSREHASSQGRAQCIQPSIHSQTYRFAISQE